MKIKKEIKQNPSPSYKITIFRTEFISILIKNDQSCNTRIFAPHPIVFPGIKQQSLSLVYTRRKKKSLSYEFQTAVSRSQIADEFADFCKVRMQL